MALRVTQTYTEVLGDDSGGNLRVTQLYVEALGPTGGLRAEVSDSITFTEAVQSQHIIPGVHYVFDSIILSETLKRKIFVNVSDTFSMTDGFTSRAIDHLTFTETVVGRNIPRANDTITFTETVDRKVSFLRNPVEILTFVDHAVPLLINECTTREYAPFGNLPTEPPLNEGLLTLYHDTTTVVLRNPDFLDRNELIFTRINRVSRGGTLTIFTDPTWPKYQTLTLDVRMFKAAQVADLKSFLAATLGKEIILRDWLGQSWTGVITNPDADISQTGRNLWEVTLVFDGEEGTQSAQSEEMAFTETVTVTLHRKRIVPDTLTLEETAVGQSFTGLLGRGVLENYFMLGGPP